MKSKDNRSMVVERYTATDRIAHTVHAIAMLVLIITGLKIYTGWDFMSFHTARGLHMIMVPFLLAVNWILILTTSSPKAMGLWERFHTLRTIIFSVLKMQLVWAV